MFHKAITTAALVGVALVGHTVVTRLPTDALVLAVGVCFGILAGIPTSLLMLASNRASGPSAVEYWRQRALEAEDRNQRIQTRLAGLIDGQSTIVKTMSQDILQ